MYANGGHKYDKNNPPPPPPQTPTSNGSMCWLKVLASQNIHLPLKHNSLDKIKSWFLL